MKNFISKHINLLHILGLAVACYFVLFYNLGGYPLIDVDETRYVAMARDMFKTNDFMTLFLNGEYFFEKPPLYFWLLSASFKLFGVVNEWTARFPVALVSTLGVFFTYFYARKTVSKTFALISSLILLTSFEFILLSRISILDLMLSVFSAMSVLSGFLSLYVQEKNQKYCWWFAYIFSALAFLSKGIPGVVIPAGSLFFGMIFTGNFKQLFKPINFIVGVLIFSAITIPWHLAMIQLHGDLFVDEYIIKHHIARFVDSAGLGRKEPFWFFIPVFLVGFIPWCVSFINLCVIKIKEISDKLKQNIPFKEVVQIDNKNKKMLLLMAIYAGWTFLFFSLASTKLPTYILPLFPAVSLICGYYWWQYITSGRYKKSAEVSSLYFFGIFAFVGLLALISVDNLAGLLSAAVQTSELFDILKPMLQSAGVLFLAIFILALFAMRFGNRKLLFSCYVLLMAGIIMISSHFLFKFIYTFGQHEIVNYAKIAKQVENSKLITFGYGVRSSAHWTYDDKVYHLSNDKKMAELEKQLSDDKKHYVIIRTKSFATYRPDFEKMGLRPLKTGHKYSLFEK